MNKILSVAKPCPFCGSTDLDISEKIVVIFVFIVKTVILTALESWNMDYLKIIELG